MAAFTLFILSRKSLGNYHIYHKFLVLIQKCSANQLQGEIFHASVKIKQHFVKFTWLQLAMFY